MINVCNIGVYVCVLHVYVHLAQKAVKGTVLPSESDEERMKERLDAVLERLHKTDEVSEFQKKLVIQQSIAYTHTSYV